MSVHEWHKWTIVYDASHQSYVEDKLSKKTILPPPPIWRPLKDIAIKVEKAKYGTEVYHHVNFHSNRHEMSVPGQKYIFILLCHWKAVTTDVHKNG